MIACRGAMSIGGMHGDEENARRNERAHGAVERKQERRERWALSVEVKDSSLPPLRFIDPWEPRSPNHALRAH
jgi:hypothetical protein